ncbi:MAG: hypothetical protein ABS76_09435 [Pelagibacterium sp. SCN 64-44]|nr:MAG: hypothetical protein ABS76_09435 [Pelagibacterium sp. SCN 64-44]
MRADRIDWARNGYALPVALLLLLAMLSFALVPLMVALFRPYFVYYNGSDEQIYLTFQGALALLQDRSRGLSSKLVLLGHELGLSGAVINLVMDLISPWAIFAMVAYLLRKGMDERSPLVAAWWVVFGSVLFNQANPFLEGLLPDFRYQDTFWISAFEGFAPFIRSPEPQLSILIALAAACLYLRTNIWLLLFLPMPFLYDNVVVPYGYLVSVALAVRYLRADTARKAVVLNLALCVALALALLILDRLGAFASMAALPTHYRQTHLPGLSLSLIVALASLLHMAWRRRGVKTPLGAFDQAVVAVAGLQLFITNHSAISGISIFPQALQSVGGTFGAAFLLFWNLKTAFYKIRNAEINLLLIFGVFIIYAINCSQGFSLLSRSYRFNIYHDISKEDLEKFRDNPLGYVGGTQFFKGYVGMAYPKQLIPPLAHYYYFPFYMSKCAPLAKINADAIEFIDAHRDDPALESRAAEIAGEVDAVNASLAAIDSYTDACPAGVPGKIDFDIYETHDDTMLLLKLLPPAILRQGVDF